MSKHKTLGQAYTPKWIVHELLDLIGYNKDAVLGKYILEPACGTGVFLIEIVKKYISIAQKQSLTTKQIITHLETYIYGVELDEDAHTKCICPLNQLTQNLLGIARVNWKIYQENTLDFYKRHLVFSISSSTIRPISDTN